MLVCADVSAKQLKYAIKCGDKTSTAVFDSAQNGKNIDLTVTKGAHKEIMTFDASYNTLNWRLINTSDDTDVRVTRGGGKFHFVGKFKGEPVERSVEDKGGPWYQHIAFSAGHVLKEGTTEYVCIRPTDIEVFRMLVTPKGQTDFGGARPVRLKVSPAGAISKLWSCDYYYDPETLDFFGYKAVEGGPGTPVTTWILTK